MAVGREWLRWRIAAILIGLTVWAWAAPPLTTIQDVLYRADGTRFNGTAFIEWKSFEAADASNIATSSVAVQIVNGTLRVQLVPTTNASAGAYYSVRYNSGGRIEFTETWAVPPSATALRLRDVRVASGQQGGSPVAPPAALTQVQEADVVGLLNDLAIRPVKGAGYAPSRAAFISETGALEAVIGNLSDCVRVDGTAGPCGSSGSPGPGFVDGETPAGLINGSNATFTLGDSPSPPSSLMLYRNGMLQQQQLDYTLSANTITFAGGSIPQPGDTLVAVYRLADAGNPGGAAGGALTGTYPNPSIAPGVISDINIADTAGIAEAKLALHYATHSSANDPSAEQKAALGGTAGTPSGSNRYVTDQDARLSNARTPAAHPLLGAAHGDTAAGTAVRGDLIVAQGTSPTAWTRLPIGPANRCLMSNGFDAVWNTCLFTGFAAGSIPFVDANGNLSQNNARLYWDNSSRRLSVGTNTGLTTLYLHDATPGSGSTGLTVRAGQGQGSNPLQVWLDPSAAELARLDAAGNLTASSMRGASSGSRAAWGDVGTPADPAAPANGDLWYNTSLQARKSVEAGQVHAQPQVICSGAGASTNSTALTSLGTCTIPANFLKPGDRVAIRFDYSHEGAGTGFSFELRWGATSVVARAAAAGEGFVTGAAETAIYTGGAQWSVTSWGNSLAMAAGAGPASDSVASPLTVYFLGRMSASTAETISLRGFSVIRYPALMNP